MANKKFIKTFSLIVIYAFFTNNLCSSQESFEPPIWEFTDKNSDPIVAGILIGIDKAGIKVRDGLGDSHFIAFKTLSKSSQHRCFQTNSGMGNSQVFKHSSKFQHIPFL